MKKLMLIVCMTVILSMCIASFSMAQDEWQNISAMRVSFSLPSDWEKLDEFIELSEQEGAWFTGDIERPNAYIIMAQGEDLFFSWR